MYGWLVRPNLENSRWQIGSSPEGSKIHGQFGRGLVELLVVTGSIIRSAKYLTCCMVGWSSLLLSTKDGKSEVIRKGARFVNILVGALFGLVSCSNPGCLVKEALHLIGCRQITDN